LRSSSVGSGLVLLFSGLNIVANAVEITLYACDRLVPRYHLVSATVKVAMWCIYLLLSWAGVVREIYWARFIAVTVL